MQNATLEEWYIYIEHSPYQAPETGFPCLVGYSKDHPELGSMHLMKGEPIRTSEVQSIDVKTMTARTRNTVYQLGKMKESWAAYLEKNGLTFESYSEKLNARQKAKG